jgi:hypothetical protein
VRNEWGERSMQLQLNIPKTEKRASHKTKNITFSHSLFYQNFNDPLAIFNNYLHAFCFDAALQPVERHIAAATRQSDFAKRGV